MALLEIKDLTLRFGGLTAVDNVSFSVEDKSITGLIGQNGAGKTTVFNLLTYVYQPNSGQIFLDGKEMKGKKPHQAVTQGLTRTFQNIRLFRNMPVIDNVKVGCLQQGKYSVASGIFRLPPIGKKKKKHIIKHLNCWMSLIWYLMPIIMRRVCLMVSSASWRSAVPWRPSHASCCWMSRPQA